MKLDIYRLSESELRNKIVPLLPNNILIVEDNKDVTDDFIRYLDRIFSSSEPSAKSKVDQEYCIEGALRKLTQNARDFSLVLIDIALPRTYSDLRECKSKEEQRNRLAQEAVTTKDGMERKRLSERINDIDDEIADIWDFDGGINLVEKWYKSQGPLSDESLPKIIFFTAQLNDVERFREKYEACISKCGVKNPGWMLKEVSEISFLRKLLQILQK